MYRQKTNPKKDKKIFEKTSAKQNIKNQTKTLIRGGRYL